MFNPFVDFSNLTIEELTEKKIELTKKLLGVQNLRVRDQIYGILNQIELLTQEKAEARLRKEYEESEDYNSDILYQINTAEIYFCNISADRIEALNRQLDDDAYILKRVA